MSDFFNELEEDIREERIFVLWNKYGNYIIGLALAVVIGTAGYTFWNYWKNQQRLKGHVSFSQAVTLAKQGKTDEALKAFHSIIQGGGGYGKLAQLYEAALISNPEALYVKIAKENASDPALGTLAKVLQGSRSLGEQNTVQDLETLTAPNNAWAPLAAELLALADLKKGNEAEAAEKYVKILKERYATPAEHQRAALMLSQLEVPASLLKDDSQGGDSQ